MISVYHLRQDNIFLLIEKFVVTSYNILSDRIAKTKVLNIIISIIDIAKHIPDMVNFSNNFIVKKSKI